MERRSPLVETNVEPAAQARHSAPANLHQVIDQLEKAAAGGEDVSIGSIIDVVGRRSLGPMLVVVGLIAASPLSGVPGVPSTLGVLVALVATQLLFGSDDIWLPRWIVGRRLSERKYCRVLSALRGPARITDRLLRPRLVALTRRSGAFAVALLCIVIGLAMPPLELLPFSTSVAGIALAAFGLSLISHDGALGLAAFIVTFGLAAFTVYALTT